MPQRLPQLFGREGAAEFLEIDESLPGACPPSRHGRALRIPSTLEQRGTLNRTEEIAAMAPGTMIASAFTCFGLPFVCLTTYSLSSLVTLYFAKTVEPSGQ